jgi:triphosphoribosyl-dephospho-CoA synthase
MNPDAQRIGHFASAALEKEARLSPKPGLVDAENSGAHGDMDLALLCGSAEALEPHFALFAARGIAESALPPEGRLAAIRTDGLAAEKAMFLATNGVNTHKGALFLLGILCYAAGYCAGRGEKPLPESVCAIAGRVCAGVTRELGADAGRAYARYGATGARGEAEAGFPHALLALEAFLKAQTQGAGEEDGWRIALLTLIEKLDDANVLSRCGEEVALALKARAGGLARRFPAGGEALVGEIRALDEDCVRWRASPGGAADILACAMFLHEIVNL